MKGPMINSLHRMFGVARQSFEGGARLGHIHCADGFRMSVQASELHYCEPKSDIGPWTEFEVGYPTPPEPLLFPYGSLREDGSYDSVFGNVPAELIDRIMVKHGGIVRIGGKK
jgi:hypothetical protein